MPHGGSGHPVLISVLEFRVHWQVSDSKLSNPLLRARVGFACYWGEKPLRGKEDGQQFEGEVESLGVVQRSSTYTRS